MKPKRERRIRRSSMTGEALHYQLEYVAKEQELVALVLADSAGMLVAANRSGPEAEELAAVAPIAARRASLCAKNPVAEERYLPCAVGQFTVDDVPLYILAVGNRRKARMAIASASFGVRRILTVSNVC